MYNIISVTVCYCPDVDLLRSQLVVFDPAMTKILIDNTGEGREDLEMLKSDVMNLQIIVNNDNVGLAAALNQGVHYISEFYPDAQFAFLLDQDSVPASDCLYELRKQYDFLETRGERVGAVGPYVQDRMTGYFHGFHQMTRLRWRRVFPTPGGGEPIPCVNLNGSGVMMRIDLFLEMGGLDETLFIDHVDTEWAFRLVSRGYSLWGAPSAVMQHQMGQNSMPFWLFGWKVWPMRSPERHRFLFRNAVVLMKRNYVPLLWKTWAVAKLLITLVVHGLFDKQRGQQARAMVNGVIEGLRS